jgi:beta-mannosidase
LYYKLNDNFPAASWSTVDWYGAPKIGHYLIQDAFTPLHACVLFQTTRPYGSRQDWPVFLLDDASALADHAWSVSVRVRDGSLKLVAEKEFAGIGSIASPLAVGSVTLTADQTRSVPLLVTVEVRVDGTLADRTFYFLNYEQAAGCLFRLPRTSLAWTIDHISGHIAVSNRSDSVPAVAVRISKSGCLDQMRLSDNYFWLEPGETHMVLSSILDGIEVDAWNAI